MAGSFVKCLKETETYNKAGECYGRRETENPISDADAAGGDGSGTSDECDPALREDAVTL